MNERPRSSRPRGASTKLDDLRAKRILDALRAGHSFRAAARAGGIDETTLHGWRRRGAAGDADYVQFFKRVDEACQEAENRCVQVLRSALEGDDLRLATDTAWKWLARRRPAEWGEVKGEVKPDTEVAAEVTGEDLAIVESVRSALLSSTKGRKAG